MTPSETEQPESARTDESFLVRFAREYGWRAYAIPVLAVITIWLLADIALGGGDDATRADSAGDTTATQASEEANVPEPPADRGGGPDPANAGEMDLEPDELPPGGPFAQSGDKTYRVVGTPGASAGVGEEAVVRYVVEVENGVETAHYGGDEAVARLVDATLADPRGWTNDPAFRFEHVAEDENPNLRIRLTSADTTREMCGAEDFAVETSCRTTVTGESTVMLNDSRWSRGAQTFEGDIGSYRQYLINHEVGHAIGYADHVACGGDGELAPVMMQQTLSLNNAELNARAPHEVYPDRDETCRYNGWPYPQPGADPLPGAVPDEELQREAE
ncbi:hypothetical protein C3B44_02845 [Corynebacterium yudongzhengii]|uniref:DUF3152 domain-containing protein n=1 Tax=Corynebacterium yudongzhengii TaxID=2080740 RepID=A0A2U1T506_9CORY|nr:DUF3152 domain-containing protein [Corynebacterium yudongzhengii]AWB81423.1 hypothetical protein C3B44_02845 [Corynebacterium yudongzhengii]PWC01079.1 DUF3152 domain-containing protein [Corynebacterium yudongzhengii]